MTGRTGTCIALLGLLLTASPAQAQSHGGTAGQTSEPAWSFRLTGNTYFLPDQANYLQPTFTADRRALHLESRYHYEAAGSASAFAGWNLEFGSTVKLSLTPMLGGLFGKTSGIIPALEGDLEWRRLEFYSEGEYVIDLGDTHGSFFYNWSEFSVWTTDWLRTGIVTQRTHVINTPREIQRGLFVGVKVSAIEGTFYAFNPGADDRFYVASVGVKF